ncbi:polyketide synthase [gut metagenome]|uniref:Polyketide synthase n=1 Tax=gut metagenome TaxID=749906 RepID=J9GC58_9ZZZZ
MIRATGVNSDGRTSGIALPNGEAQRQLLASIYDDPRVDRRRIAYVEAHGTGTAAGDPIETRSIGQVLGHTAEDEAPLWIGSVKGNLGHLETGSGMAGLAKVLNVLEHQQIPPNIQLKKPNPKIDFQGLGLRVPTANEPLPTDSKGRPAMACVNSFGFGGTNAHVLLEESRSCPSVSPEEPAAQDPLPLMISAKSMDSLQALACAYADRLREADPADYNRTAAACARQRDRLPYVLMIHGKTLAESLEALCYFAKEGTLRDDLPAAVEHNTLSGSGKTAFVYSGNGSQWAGMGADLMANSLRFGEVIDEIDAYFEPLAGWRIRDYLLKNPADWALEKTENAQPLLFAVQVGLTVLLRESGVKADAVTGHSVGEVASAWACGALTLSEAVRVIYERSALQGKMYGSGTMAAAKLKEDVLLGLLKEKPGVEIAGWNAPDNFTLSGDADQIDALKALGQRSGRSL